MVKAGIDALPRLAESGEPWVLFIGPVGPHDPFVVERRFVDMYDLDDIPLPPNVGDRLEDKPNV